MHLKRVVIKGFKTLRDFQMDVGEQLNILVGNNETGKSTVLDAVNLVLTGQMEGRPVQYDLNPYYFNADVVAEYFKGSQKCPQPETPRILIEAYLDDDGSNCLAKLKGSNNSLNEDCPGVYLTIELNPDCAADFAAYVADAPNRQLCLIPVEYFLVVWRTFANNTVVARCLPFRAKVIDTSLMRSYSGPNRYLARIIDDFLLPDQRIALSAAYRQLKQAFMQQKGIAEINDHLKGKRGSITTKDLSISLDMSARSTWDSSITAHLDNIPFDDVGKGEQCRVQMKLAIEATNADSVLLIEEPENHLSYSNMACLIDEIEAKSAGRQVLIATHSSFVLNRLGVDNVRLLANGTVTSMSGLSPKTIDYFKKLPGYDTLRLLLAARTILVEGPSDELVVQKAYLAEHKRLPLADRVDVIAVGSLAFKRTELGTVTY